MKKFLLFNQDNRAVSEEPVSALEIVDSLS